MTNKNKQQGFEILTPSYRWGFLFFKVFIMKDIIMSFLSHLKKALTLKKTEEKVDHVLKVYNGKFAFCGASPAIPTGNIITVQGREFREGRSVCPVMNGPSIANVALVPDPSVTPDGTENTVWSYFWYFDEVPQAPTWETLPTVNRSFVIGDEPSNQMSNMFCMPCKVFAEENGVSLAECFGPLNELAVPLRRALRAHKGQTSITQAPEGSPYPVGTIIPVTNNQLEK